MGAGKQKLLLLMTPHITSAIIKPQQEPVVAAHVPPQNATPTGAPCSITPHNDKYIYLSVS